VAEIIFVVDETNEAAMSLMKKLANAKTGAVTPVTHEEFIAAQNGSLHPIEIGDTHG